MCICWIVHLISFLVSVTYCSNNPVTPFFFNPTTLRSLNENMIFLLRVTSSVGLVQPVECVFVCCSLFEIKLGSEGRPSRDCSSSQHDRGKKTNAFSEKLGNKERDQGLFVTHTSFFFQILDLCSFPFISYSLRLSLLFLFLPAVILTPE